MARLRIAQVAAAGMTLSVLLRDHFRALSDAGHEVIGICAPGPWAERLRAEGVAVETVEMERELSPLHDLAALDRLAHCFRANRFDVVHTHTPKAGIIGPVAARRASVPCVVHTIHGLLFHDAMPRWRRSLFWLPEKITAAYSDYLLSQSREDMDIAVRSGLCRPEKLRYIGNGIDVERFAPHNGDRSAAAADFGFAAGDFIVGSVGRLVYEKGFADLFAAARRVLARRRDIKFLIVAPRDEGQRDSVPREQFADLESTGALRVLDWSSDLTRCYSAMDLFVFPSHREGIPRACLEAEASGLPVVASNIRGCREVVLDGQTGVLVPMRDPEALAAAIERLADDRDRARSMGTAARLHVEQNFNREQMMERLVQFYESLAEKRAMTGSA